VEIAQTKTIQNAGAITKATSPIIPQKTAHHHLGTTPNNNNKKNTTLPNSHTRNLLEIQEHKQRYNIKKRRNPHPSSLNEPIP